MKLWISRCSFRNSFVRRTYRFGHGREGVAGIEPQVKKPIKDWLGTIPSEGRTDHGSEKSDFVHIFEIFTF